MYEAACEARNTQMPPISSGVPCVRRGSSNSRRCLRRLAGVVDHRLSAYPSEGNAVDTYLPAPGRAEGAGHVVESCFGRPIGSQCATTAAGHRRLAGYVDDGPARVLLG